MEPMQILASEIFHSIKDKAYLESLIGDCEIGRISAIEDALPDSIVFLEKKEYFKYLTERKPAVVVTSNEFVNSVKELGIEVILISKNVGMSHAMIKQTYGDRNLFDSEWGRIHPSAVIHESVKIPESCTIGPNVVIGKNVRMGERCAILANSVIEYNAVLGDDVWIYSGVMIGHEVELGSRVIIKYGSVLGGEGFGFVQDEKRAYHRIPQTGKIVLEDDVLIGSNCCIDRAAYRETRVKRGTKLDNICHLAHNVVIGEDAILTAGCIIAGSTTIGNRVIMSGQTGVLDHLTVADDVILVHKAGVNSSIKKAGAYAGTPPQPINDYMKNMVIGRKLVDMKNQISNLEKRLKELEGK
ncbi:MAG: UDP-3-O-(3-hydroxymyristoyl)glucosamine N-acyltransferase [Leptospiraceae bacterium]|nr:UDP-3-O-(3-hydroxymyristoyl)glucosamine N-acyltransferase [Leptospiraceae bacterium]